MKNLKLALVAIIAILLLVNLYFITENQKLSNRITNLESQVKNLQNEEQNKKQSELEKDLEYQELVDIVTKDWNVYRNEEYGFEIKYPEKEDEVTEADCEWKNCVAYFYQRGFDIYVYSKDNKESLLNHIVKSVYPFKAGDLENIHIIEIDNRKAYQIVASVDFSIISTFVESNNYVYKLFIIKPETPEDIIEYNQIISTFKFIE